MTDLAIDDEDGGQVDEAAVGTGLLLGACSQPPEAVEPTVRDLDHPTPRWVTVGMAW